MSDKAHSQQKLQRALFLHQTGELGKASDLYSEILKSDPNNFLVLHHLGIVQASVGNFEQAKSLIKRSLKINPPNIQFIENYATILFQSEDYESALRICEKGLQINSKNLSLLYLKSVTLYKLKRLQDSITLFEKLLSLQPNHIAALNERGSVFAEMKKYDAALASVQSALAFAPQYAEAHSNSGNLYGILKRFDEALAAYDTALAYKPALVDAWLGRGNVLRELQRYNDSFAAYERALALKPDLVGAWLGRGYVALQLKQHREALAAYDRALVLQPDLAEAWVGRGTVFATLKRYEDAFAAYDRAEALEPHLRQGAGARLYSKLHLCDWTAHEAEVAQLLSTLRERDALISPFVILAIPSSPADQLQCAKRFIEDQRAFPSIWRSEIYSHDRIRVAYLSADFHEHATAYLTAGLFEQHDKSRFEVTGISFGQDQNSPMRERIKGAFEHFVDVQHKSDQEIAELIRRMEIDIAVDLKGFTQDGCPNVFARRPAPVQVNYLGYPGTMGGDHFDYILADSTVIPEDQFEFYGEKVVWLPDTYQVNDVLRPISGRTPTRRECGLPEAAFVFCCFNNVYKIAPEIFDVWMRLLKANDNSVLWLFEGNSTAAANLKQEAARRGIPPERLIFAPKMPLADHLARHRQADLFLDTLPYNAHTTASDALWAGLPVLTCLGSTFAGRVAGSLLKAIGLEEFITTSLKDYEELALKLAKDLSLVASLKDRLARNRDTYPLFNTARFTRHIEAAYQTMWDRQQKGLMPKTFSVDPVN